MEETTKQFKLSFYGKRERPEYRGKSTSYFFFLFLTALFGLTFKREKKELKHTHTHTTVAYNTNTQKGRCERDARSHARNSLILKSE